MTRPSCLVPVRYRWPEHARERNGTIVRPTFQGAMLNNMPHGTEACLWHDLNDAPWPKITFNLQKETLDDTD